MCNPSVMVCSRCITAVGNGDIAEFCAFVLNGQIGSAARFCQMPRQPGSPYCERHHALCHLPGGSAAERQKLREIEALARIAGGRQPRPAQEPGAAQLRRLDRLARAFSRPKCSRIVFRAEGEQQ